MNSFLLLAPEGAAPGDAGALDNAIVVRDSFNWAAFLAPTFWFLFTRQWLAAVAAMAGFVGVLALARFLSLGPGVVLMILLAIRLLIGLEASVLRTGSLRQRGLRLVDVVVAGGRAEAENQLFRRWLEQASVVAPAVALRDSSARPELTGASRVVGLFPEPEGGR